MMDDLVEFVAASDQRTGFERTEIPRLALSGEGWAITANGFTIPQQDGTKLGGVDVRTLVDNVVTTAAVVDSTPLPPETTPQDVRADFEQRVAAAASDPSATPNARVAIPIAAMANGLGVDPQAVLDAIDEAGGRDGALDAALAELYPPPPEDVNAEEPQPPVGKWIDLAVIS